MKYVLTIIVLAVVALWVTSCTMANRHQATIISNDPIEVPEVPEFVDPELEERFEKSEPGVNIPPAGEALEKVGEIFTEDADTTQDMNDVEVVVPVEATVPEIPHDQIWDIHNPYDGHAHQ